MSVAPFETYEKWATTMRTHLADVVVVDDDDDDEVDEVVVGGGVVETW